MDRLEILIFMYAREPYSDEEIKAIHSIKTVTCRNNIISETGIIILKEGKKYDVLKVNFSTGWWGRMTGLYYPPQPQSVLIDNPRVSIQPRSFIEFDDLLKQ